MNYNVNIKLQRQKKLTPYMQAATMLNATLSTTNNDIHKLQITLGQTSYRLHCVIFYKLAAHAIYI